jgi:thymidine kinase
MYSGKTTELLRLLNIYSIGKLNVMYINSTTDTRTPDAFSTHNAQLRTRLAPEIAQMKVSKLEAVTDDALEGVSIIGIDEGQFFPDLSSMVVKWVEHLDKRVIIASLDGDFMRRKFGGVIDLIPLADSVKKFSSVCSRCSVAAGIFTHRMSKDSTTIVAGGKDKYESLCRKCFRKATQE